MNSELYDERYFLESVGGAEFFRLYGPRIVKPAAAYALRAAGLEPGMSALDVGCGRGELLYQLRRRGVAAVGADLAAAALRLSKRTAEAPVVRCDAKRLPFRDSAFDRVFFLGVLDHLDDGELAACFAEFRRVLKPGGLVLANTCTNTQYYKRWTYGARRRLARWLGLREPRPPKSQEDEALHVNEHDEGGLRRFFAAQGWTADVEARPNDKYAVAELYGEDRPVDFPLRPAPAWKRAYVRLAFAGPWKRYLAREFFCKITPIPEGGDGKEE